MRDKTNTVRSRSRCIKRTIPEVMQLRTIVLQWASAPTTPSAQVVYKEWKHLSTRTLHSFVSVEKESAYCIALSGFLGENSQRAWRKRFCTIAGSIPVYVAKVPPGIAGLKWLCTDRLLFFWFSSCADTHASNGKQKLHVGSKFGPLAQLVRASGS